MKFYHATTKKSWAAIQAEGVLWGVRDVGVRVTWLSTTLKDARLWAAVVLEVEYTPKEGQDNYMDECWQCRVYVPIPMVDVRVLEINNTPHWNSI